MPPVPEPDVPLPVPEPEVPLPVPPPVPPLTGGVVLGALGVTTPPLLLDELELLELLELLVLVPEEVIGWPHSLEAVGGRCRLGLGLGVVELGLELRGVLAALDGEADLLAGRDLVGHRLQELVQGRVAGRVELLDLVHDALAELSDLVRLGESLAGRGELLDRAVRLGADRVRLGDELRLALARLRRRRSRDRSLGRAVATAGRESESRSNRRDQDEHMSQAPHTAAQGSKDAGSARSNKAPKTKSRHLPTPLTPGLGLEPRSPAPEAGVLPARRPRKAARTIASVFGRNSPQGVTSARSLSGSPSRAFASSDPTSTPSASSVRAWPRSSERSTLKAPATLPSLR